MPRPCFTYYEQHSLLVAWLITELGGEVLFIIQSDLIGCLSYKLDFFQSLIAGTQSDRVCYEGRIPAYFVIEHVLCGITKIQILTSLPALATVM